MSGASIAQSEVTAIPDDDKAREIEARFSMLETLADHDDLLMEQLLDEKEPPRDAVFDDLAADLRDGAITPVLIGTAEKGNGVLRLLKTIRHDAPDIEATKARLGVKDGPATVAQVMKTVHTAHGGKLSMARILSGAVDDGPSCGCRTAAAARSPASTGCSARTRPSRPPPRPATPWRSASSTMSRPATR